MQIRSSYYLTSFRERNQDVLTERKCFYKIQTNVRKNYCNMPLCVILYICGKNVCSNEAIYGDCLFNIVNGIANFGFQPLQKSYTATSARAKVKFLMSFTIAEQKGF